MTAHFLKIARLSSIITLLYFLIRSFITILRGETPTSTLTFYDFLIIAFTTILLSYALIDSATFAGVVRLNVGSFTVSLRRDIQKPLILYDDEWNTDCLKVREALSSLGIPALIHPIPQLSSNTHYFHNYPLESRFIADAIMHHPQLQLIIPLLYDPNTGAVIYGDGEHINNYIYSTYSKRLTDVDPPPPLTIGPLDLVTSLISVNLRKGTVYGAVARPSIYNKSPLHLYACQSDGPSRVIREWLCRLQLSYLLFPTPRGAIYRAVLLHQVGSFYHTHRSRLVYERFNILAAYEHQRKQLLETIGSDEFNAGMDQIDWLEKVSGSHNAPHHSNINNNSQNSYSTLQNRTLNQPTHSSQQTIVLQDPLTNGYTVMRGGTAQANFNQDDFFRRLEHHGYPTTSSMFPNEEYNGDNLNCLGDPDITVDKMYQNRLLGDDDNNDKSGQHTPSNPTTDTGLSYLYAVDNTAVNNTNLDGLSRENNPSPHQLDDTKQPPYTSHRVQMIPFGPHHLNGGTISIVDDSDPLPVLDSIKRADRVRGDIETSIASKLQTSNHHGSSSIDLPTTPLTSALPSSSPVAAFPPNQNQQYLTIMAARISPIIPSNNTHSIMMRLWMFIPHHEITHQIQKGQITAL